MTVVDKEQLRLFTIVRESLISYVVAELMDDPQTDSPMIRLKNPVQVQAIATPDGNPAITLGGFPHPFLDSPEVISIYKKDIFLMTRVPSDKLVSAYTEKFQEIATPSQELVLP